MPEFKVGDRVVCVKPVDSNQNIVGMHGTIVASGTGKPGVEFDEYMGGHTVDGRVRDGYGWFCYKDCLVPEEDEPLEPFSAPEISF